MPRGQKSKARAREKRQQIKTKSQEHTGAQTMTTDQREVSFSSAHASVDAIPTSAAESFLQKLQALQSTTTFNICIACRRSTRSDRFQKKKSVSSSRAQHSTRSPQKDLTRKTGMLLEYMLSKYKMKEPLLREEMQKVVNECLKEQFTEILKKASNRVDLVFGLELKEAQPDGQSYVLVSKLDFHDDGSSSTEMGLPNRGILIPLLSVIYLHGYCASEEQIWHFLNTLGIYDGVSHIIFGDTRKLITQDLVQEKYLEYRQVPNSDPPHFEFLWGPQAHANKKKVMEFLANINETGTPAYPVHYEEVLSEENKSAQAEDAD
ncbi:melanoma-associated antigen B4-like [Nannospalax galili]|uniref:melanoma-associated antigen B4-like n=1 Tax=Nannospalax galili TaxID=1026970 RepID=UPI0004ED554B|nr:melanoma-associated antigen B4-like [Nannospalax galili]